MVNLYCRCSKYSRVPSGCSLVPDPKDPSCCEVPHCDMIIPSIPPTPGILTPPMPQPGIITGTGKVPNLIGGIFYNHLIYFPLYLNLFFCSNVSILFFFFFISTQNVSLCLNKWLSIPEIFGIYIFYQGIYIILGW